MLRFGICTRAQYEREAERRNLAASEISYNLMDVGEDATEEEIRLFEAISFSLRTSNGTTRMTFSNRFRDVDEAASHVLSRFFAGDAGLLVQDRAMSHGLTSSEWAQKLFRDFPRAQVEASDRILFLYRISLSNEESFILEPDGHPLQYVRPPFVVSIGHREPLRFPLNHLVSLRARRRFRRLGLPEGWRDSQGGKDYKITKICCVHPKARLLSKRDSRFRICARSVFDRTPGLSVLRTMNILNKAYFSSEQLVDGAMAAFESLQPGGIWIVGRTLEEDSTNHVTFLRKREDGWEALERIGGGSEMEEFIARGPALFEGQGR